MNCRRQSPRRSSPKLPRLTLHEAWRITLCCLIGATFPTAALVIVTLRHAL